MDIYFSNRSTHTSARRSMKHILSFLPWILLNRPRLVPPSNTDSVSLCKKHTHNKPHRGSTRALKLGDGPLPTQRVRLRLDSPNESLRCLQFYAERNNKPILIPGQSQTATVQPTRVDSSSRDCFCDGTYHFMCILARSSDFLPTTIIIECGQDPMRRSNEPIGRIFRFDPSIDALAVSRIASIVRAVWQI